MKLLCLNIIIAITVVFSSLLVSNASKVSQRKERSWIAEVDDRYFNVNSKNLRFPNKLTNNVKPLKHRKITSESHSRNEGTSLYVFDDMDESDVLSLEGVKTVHPNLYAYPFAYNWAKDRVDGKVDNEYNSTYTGKGVNIFIVDTGCDTTHIEFDTAGREVQNIASFTDKGRDREIGSNNDISGHGTHVAGSASGRTVGTAKDANLYCIKVFDDATGVASTSNIIGALTFITDWRQANGGDKTMVVVNLSLGYKCQFNNCFGDILVSNVNRIAALGIVVVVAAGNDGEKDLAVSPASARDCLSVGATDQADEVAFYSNYGIYVDYWAPGSNVKSAATSSCVQDICFFQNQYISYSGTSMASSIVAGLVALLLERIAPTEIEINSLAAVNMVKETIKCESQQNVITGQNGSVNDLVKVTVPSA